MFCKLNKYGELNNYDLFKVFAFIFMIVDHVGLFFFPSITILRVIGRVSFPIYAVLHSIVTKNNNTEYKANYLLLFTGLLINIIFYMLFGQLIAANILISFFLFDLIFNKISKLDYKVLVSSFVLVIVNCCFYNILNTYIEYGLFALLFMIVGRIFYKVGTNIVENLFSLSVFVTYFLTQVMFFGFNKVHAIICGIFIFVMFLLMYDFKFREYHNMNSNKFLLFLSRYSLELYFVHYILFMFMTKIYIL